MLVVRAGHQLCFRLAAAQAGAHALTVLGGGRVLGDRPLAPVVTQRLRLLHIPHAAAFADRDLIAVFRAACRRAGNRIVVAECGQRGIIRRAAIGACGFNVAAFRAGRVLARGLPRVVVLIGKFYGEAALRPRNDGVVMLDCRDSQLIGDGAARLVGLGQTVKRNALGVAADIALGIGRAAGMQLQVQALRALLGVSLARGDLLAAPLDGDFEREQGIRRDRVRLHGVVDHQLAVGHVQNRDCAVLHKIGLARRRITDALDVVAAERHRAEAEIAIRIRGSGAFKRLAGVGRAGEPERQSGGDRLARRAVRYVEPDHVRRGIELGGGSVRLIVAQIVVARILRRAAGRGKVANDQFHVVVAAALRLQMLRNGADVGCAAAFDGERAGDDRQNAVMELIAIRDDALFEVEIARLRRRGDRAAEIGKLPARQLQTLAVVEHVRQHAVQIVHRAQTQSIRVGDRVADMQRALRAGFAAHHELLVRVGSVRREHVRAAEGGNQHHQRQEKCKVTFHSKTSLSDFGGHNI